MTTVLFFGKYRLDKQFILLVSKEEIEKNRLNFREKLVLYDDFYIQHSNGKVEYKNIWSSDFRKAISKTGFSWVDIKESGVAFCSYEKILLERFCDDDYDFYSLASIIVNLSGLKLLRSYGRYWEQYLYALYYLKGKDALYSEITKSINDSDSSSDVLGVSVLWMNYFYHQYPNDTFLDFEEFMKKHLRKLVSNPSLSEDLRKKVFILYVKYDWKKILENKEAFEVQLRGFDGNYSKFVKAYLSDVKKDQGIGYLYSLAIDSLDNNTFLLPYFFNFIALNKDDLFAQKIAQVLERRYKREEVGLIKKITGQVETLSKIQYLPDTEVP